MKPFLGSGELIGLPAGASEQGQPTDSTPSSSLNGQQRLPTMPADVRQISARICPGKQMSRHFCTKERNGSHLHCVGKLRGQRHSLERGRQGGHRVCALDDPVAGAHQSVESLLED